MKTPILGSSYVARSVNAADNRCVNLFAEAITEGGNTTGFLNRCPGLLYITAVGLGPIRGMWQFGGFGYIVSGSYLYRITIGNVVTTLGAIAGTGMVSMADNGTQLFIAANPQGYIYNSSTSAFAQITDADFPGAVTVTYLDGYFIFVEPNSQKVWVTSLLDGTSIDPLDFASAEGAPDNLVAGIVNNRELWLFGVNSVEVWYNSGGADFPLSRIQGASNELGCSSPYSIAKLDNSLFWLGLDARGAGIVYRAVGYTGKRISTHAIEYAIQSYSTITDAIAFTYQQEGHSFYVLTFPTADKTWVFDVSTELWHERAGFVDGEFTRHRAQCQMFFTGVTFVGDYENGNIYTYSLDTYTDNAAAQKYLRSWRALPAGQNNLNRSAHHSLQLNCESGVGLDGTGQGTDPQVLLRWSDDGGHTWSNEHSKSLGRIGKTGQRVIWRRLGATLKLRDRVYEISGTDPTKIVIMGAELHAGGTNA